MKTPLFKIVAASAALVAPVLVAPYAQPASSDNRCLTQTEYQIYEIILGEYKPVDEFDAFLKSERPDYVMPRLKFLISDRTTAAIGGSFDGIRPKYKPDSVDSNIWSEIVTDLRRKPICTIEDKFSALVPVRITTEEEFEELRGGKYGMFWENVRERFGPSAVVHFSRVGFNVTGDVAALYYSYSTGGLSGAGYTVVVEKTDDGWHIQEALMLWIS